MAVFVLFLDFVVKHLLRRRRKAGAGLRGRLLDSECQVSYRARDKTRRFERQSATNHRAALDLGQALRTETDELQRERAQRWLY
ncbi:hypothetical protein Q7C36_019734 [Tachysurus vachellii]|uniref:Uncharacterized protein n=1 Tax=Tachysurus vachellii TaxID=175792 RepID=A0AA88LSE8_TACVA|nr:hypothetical protein Q7C36_019734 [Tachysurus vachellii]